jgi:hypothetical protein
MPGYVPPPPARVEDGREVEGGGGQVGDRGRGLSLPTHQTGHCRGAFPWKGSGRALDSGLPGGDAAPPDGGGGPRTNSPGARRPRSSGAGGSQPTAHRTTVATTSIASADPALIHFRILTSGDSQCHTCVTWMDRDMKTSAPKTLTDAAAGGANCVREGPTGAAWSSTRCAGAGISTASSRSDPCDISGEAAWGWWSGSSAIVQLNGCKRIVQIE